MKLGSLCSGYGGLEMGIGMRLPVETAWHAEVDKSPAAILRHHWPGVPNLGNLKTVDWAAVEPVEMLCGGYPCQPFSLAGDRKGTTDERHLWPYIAVAISALRPRWLFFENVAGHLSLGLDCVLGDLAALGYDARWGVVPAAGAGAPQLRERVFILAGDSNRVAWAAPGSQCWGPDQVDNVGDQLGAVGSDGLPVAADTCGQRHPRRRDSDAGRAAEPQAQGWTGSAWGAYGPAIRRWEGILGRPAPSALEPRPAPGEGMRLAASFVEWVMGLPAGHVTGVPGIPHTHQLKALGNGVVPLQAALALALLSR